MPEYDAGEIRDPRSKGYVDGYRAAIKELGTWLANHALDIDDGSLRAKLETEFAEGLVEEATTWLEASLNDDVASILDTEACE